MEMIKNPYGMGIFGSIQTQMKLGNLANFWRWEEYYYFIWILNGVYRLFMFYPILTELDTLKNKNKISWSGDGLA